MKKVFSVILAIALLCMMAIPAFAAEETYTLTITGAAGHTYDVYQIFTGDISKEGDTTVLSNVKYGQNYYPHATGAVGDAVPDDVLASFTDGQTTADLLLSAVSGTPIANDVTPADGETSVEITGLVPGYYMVVDVTTSLPEGQTKSPVILQIVESVSIASKHAGITSEKKVDDENDSTSAEDNVSWQDSADYDIGDDVPFKISATIPATYTTYETYEIVFHDMQAAGLDAPVITKVYVANANGEEVAAIPAVSTTVTNGYTLTTGACGEAECEFGANCSFSVKVGDLKKLITGYAEGMQIVVEYTSKLNADANVGSIGNENGMYVHHPDGHTTQDYVIVFTYALTGNKIDGATQEALPGAGFTLYKYDHDATTADKWVAVGEEITGAALTTFTWSGIDDGKYKLVETTTPAGYNTMAPIEFEVTAQHKEEWVKGGNSAFLDLIAKDASGNIVFADAKEVDNVSVEDGILEGTLVNNKGTVLPETGAIGTMIFIAGGTVLAMGSTVFMVTRKKMSIYED